MVEHHYLVSSRVYGLELCHDALDVVERFQLVGCPIHHIASVAADDSRDAVFSRLLSMVGGYRVGHDYHRRFRAAPGIKAKATASSCDNESDVSIKVIVLAKGLYNRVGHVFFAVRHVDSRDLESFVE